MSKESELLARIEELESQLAFQDELHSQLNDIVARQDKELSELKTRFEALARKVSDIGNSMPAAGGDPSEEVPPHY